MLFSLFIRGKLVHRLLLDHWNCSTWTSVWFMVKLIFFGNVASSNCLANNCYVLNIFEKQTIVYSANHAIWSLLILACPLLIGLSIHCIFSFFCWWSSVDFPGKYQDWAATDPLDLFQAQVIKNESNPKVFCYNNPLGLSSSISFKRIIYALFIRAIRLYLYLFFFNWDPILWCFIWSLEEYFCMRYVSCISQRMFSILFLQTVWIFLEVCLEECSGTFCWLLSCIFVVSDGKFIKHSISSCWGASANFITQWCTALSTHAKIS